ncbi:ribokinase [Rhodobacteraceae bacterium CCMM004]|nr:ribokinase [Rhodobacteraceae bacterium CCMM004]
MSVLVAGALHWDVIVQASRQPRLDETLPGDGVRYQLGGKAGNQALMAARLGSSVAFAGCVGDDAAGGAMRAELTAAGIDTAMLRSVEGASGMSVAIENAQGRYAAVIVSAANLAFDAAALHPPEGTAVICLQNESPEAANLALARAKGPAQVILNAAPARETSAELLQVTDILVVNALEAEDMTGHADPDLAAEALADRTGGAVVVTLGGDGLYWVQGTRGDHCPAVPVDVVSTHGAGDAFCGALAAELDRGTNLADALGMAQKVAATLISMPPSRRHEIDRAALTRDQTSRR